MAAPNEQSRSEERPHRKPLPTEESSRETRQKEAKRLLDDPAMWNAISYEMKAQKQSFRKSERVRKAKLPPTSIVDGWHSWLNKMGDLLREGARLAQKTDTTPGLELDAYSGMAYAIYQRITERNIDAELRHFQETGGV